MTDEQIINALECCSCETIMYCEDQCPFYEKCMDKQLSKYVSKYALDLIKRQQAEIERLENEVKLLTQNSITEKFPHCVLCGNGAIITKSLEDYDKIIADISSESIKEFTERLKERSRKMQSSDFSGDFWDAAVLVEDIDNLVKEMVGDTE